MKYSKDFKEEALKLSDEVGVKKAAAQLGLPYYTLSDWRNKRKEEMKRPRLPETEAEKRIRELEKENAELKTANEILKDALGFFAKDKMTKKEVKTIIYRYIFGYYNTIRVNSFNPGGWPPSVYRKMCEGEIAA